MQQNPLASFALDAVGSEEKEHIEAHLAQCPRCRAEVDAYRDVAAAIGNAVEPLPEGLWAHISSRLPESPGAARSPMPRTLRDGLGENAAYSRKSQQWPAWLRGASIGSIVGVAAAVTAILGLSLANADSQISRLQAPPPSTSSGVVAALATPGHQIVNLKNGNDHTKAQFVLAAESGDLVSSDLPTLMPNETYQLWGLIGDQPISLGLLGQVVSQSAFTLSGASGLTQLRITVEPSGGSVVPSHAVVAQGRV